MAVIWSTNPVYQFLPYVKENSGKSNTETNLEHRIWWSKFTDKESMPMYTKEWVKFNLWHLVWS